jgi:hypothetical protein
LRVLAYKETASNKVTFAAYNTSTLALYTTATDVLIAGQDIDLAFVRRNTNEFYIYVNGVSVPLTTSVAIGTNILPDISAPFTIGGEITGGTTPNYFVNGYILGMRITKGRARYNGSYTPLTAFNIDGTDVVLCTNFNTIYDEYYNIILHNDTNMIDATGNNNAISAVGTTTFDDSMYGNTRSLNGSTDYISMTDNDYLYNITSLIYFPETLTGSTTSRGLMLPFDSASSWLYLNNATSTITGETISLYNGAGIRFTSQVINAGWHSFVMRWNGTAYDFIIDGVACVMGTYSTEVPLAIGGLVLGQGSTPYFNGKFGTTRRSTISRSTSWVNVEGLAVSNQL